MDFYLLMFLLACLGLLIGAVVNAAIERLKVFDLKPINPWWPWRPEGIERRAIQYIPLLGWFFRGGETETLGKRFWLRPLLIELSFLIGAPALYWWESQGGLVEPSLRDSISSQNVTIWYASHLVLFAFMAIATFTDFDERLIPDEITLPGTFIALLIAWIFPIAALPYSVAQPGQPTRPTMEYLRFDFPKTDPFAAVALGGPGGFGMAPVPVDSGDVKDMGEIPEVCRQVTSLAIGLTIVVLWCFALAPKCLTLRYGVVAGLKIMMASLLRPARRTKPKKKYKVPPRQALLYTRILLFVAIGGVALVSAAWVAGGDRWYSLYSALIGLATGAICVWSIRIIGQFALQREAMGFGDVTLLAMIGAFLGWQPSLLVFALAPFTCLAIVVIQYLLTGENELAFGPYLCLAAAILVLLWAGIWNEWAGPMIFSMGSLLVWILLGMLVPMYLTLAVMRMIRG